MRCSATFILGCLICSPAIAAPADPATRESAPAPAVASTAPAAPADDARRAQVAAATADALGGLERDVLAAPITANLSVDQFVRKSNARDVLTKTLRRAEQIGGTRWLDDQTCQVRMELPGDAVADTLVQIARSNPRDAALPADTLARRLDDLRGMTFAATGMSTSAIERLRPPAEQPAWRGIPDEEVRAAVNDARRSAARQVFDAVEPIELPGDPGKGRLANVLADQKVHDAIEGWLMNRPVTSARFNDDLEVRVGVATEGESFWDELAAAVGDRKDLPFPSDEKARAELRRQVVARVEPTVGRAVARAAGGADAARVHAAAVVGPREVVMPAAVEDIPRDPPRWAREQVDVRGTSRAVDGRLKTARVAESVGRDRLRERVMQLPLSRRTTVGDAARHDERLSAAIDRAILRARPRKVTYLADGSVEVTFSLDLRDVWYEIDAR